AEAERCRCRPGRCGWSATTICLSGSGGPRCATFSPGVHCCCSASGFFGRSSIATYSFCTTVWPGHASWQPAMEELDISNARRLLPAYLLSTHHIISVAAPTKTTLGSAALTKGCQFCSNPRCENRLFIM